MDITQAGSHFAISPKGESQKNGVEEQDLMQ